MSLPFYDGQLEVNVVLMCKHHEYDERGLHGEKFKAYQNLYKNSEYQVLLLYYYFHVVFSSVSLIYFFIRML
jgi:hypothetical protein